MIRIDGTLQCDWCYSDALWGTSTERHEHLDLCQRHYDDVELDRRLHILNGLSGEALSICQDFHEEWKKAYPNWRDIA